MMASDNIGDTWPVDPLFEEDRERLATSLFKRQSEIIGNNAAAKMCLSVSAYSSAAIKVATISIALSKFFINFSLVLPITGSGF
jgi:hypothetical protein